MDSGLNKSLADDGIRAASTSSSDAVSSAIDIGNTQVKVIRPPVTGELTDDEAAQRLKLLRQAAVNDPNLPVEEVDAIDGALGEHDLSKEKDVIGELVDDSPYEEVRASVRPYDVDLPANTIRAWVIGMLMTTIFSGMNVLFSLRSPSFYVTSYVAQLVAYPIGCAWAKVIPNRQFAIGPLRFNFNPGPFNFKEHAIIVMMANAAYGTGAGYFTDILTVQKAFYGQDLGWGYGMLLGFTSQTLGYGIAGLAAKFLVQPANMIWPAALVNCSFMYALHDHSPNDPAKTNGWKVSAYRYFSYVWAGAFVWYFFPGWIFQALGVFAFPTFIAPNNTIVNQVFGGFSGMGLIPLTFDWTYIAGYIASPLIAPWHAIMNTIIGVVVFFWVVAPAIYFTGTWWSDYMPFFSSGSFDNTGAAYNVSRIVTPEFTLDIAKYEEYSPFFLSATFAICYGLSFAAILSTIVHCGLFHGVEIWQRARDTEGKMDDIHARMMKKYNPVPWYWFAGMLVISLALTFVTAYAWPTGLTWWAIIIAMLVAMVWMLPVGMIQAVTNIAIGLNVFTEFLVGYMLPGRPLAMMMFKTYGYMAMYQGLEFVQDMKIGHYLKVPPRTMFSAQVAATLWSVVVQTAVFYWAMGAFEGICTEDAVSNFTCPNGEVFYTASVVWGLIGPQRIFSPGSIYGKLNYFWILGAVLPFGAWLIARKWPKSFIRYINVPVILNGNAYIPPATPLIYMAWGAIGWTFNYIIRNRYRGWWGKYNYVTSAALDSGLAISTIVIVLCLSLPGATPPQWWGNVGAFETLDATSGAITKFLTPGDTFGPAKW